MSKLFFSDPLQTIVSLERNIKVTTPRMNGNDIIAVQQRLLDLGYTEVGQIDGWFGPNPEESVKEFQEDFNMSITGEIDLGNWELLFSDKVATLRNIIDTTNSVRGNNDYQIEEYNFESIPENGPGTSLSCSLTTRYNFIIMYFKRFCMPRYLN